MEAIGETLGLGIERYCAPKSAARSEREELLDRFLSRLNPDRAEAGLKPLAPSALATLLTGVPTTDLYGFYKSCERARSFSRLFWHLLKREKNPAQT